MIGIQIGFMGWALTRNQDVVVQVATTVGLACLGSICCGTRQSALVRVLKAITECVGPTVTFDIYDLCADLLNLGPAEAFDP